MESTPADFPISSSLLKIFRAHTENSIICIALSLSLSFPHGAFIPRSPAPISISYTTTRVAPHRRLVSVRLLALSFLILLLAAAVLVPYFFQTHARVDSRLHRLPVFVTLILRLSVSCMSWFFFFFFVTRRGAYVWVKIIRSVRGSLYCRHARRNGLMLCWHGRLDFDWSRWFFGLGGNVLGQIGCS